MRSRTHGLDARTERPWTTLLTTFAATLAALLASVLPAAAEDPPLVCFGNEPSWGVALESPGRAVLSLPDATPTEFAGRSSRLDFLRERAWRGKPVNGVGDELVIFLREAECSDGMSDVTHPVMARVSLPDGRFQAGCCRLASGAAATPVTPHAAPSALEGPTWRLGTLRGIDAKSLAALSPPATARFEAGRFQGFGGCNQMVGSYSIAGDRVTLSALAGTMMACPPPIMKVEDAFRRSLASPLRFAVADGGLRLFVGSEAEPTLVFAAAPPPRLEGVAWVVVNFNNGRHAVIGTLTDTTLTLSFEDGTVTGQAGCNSFRASYTQAGDRLAIGPVAATRKHCGGEGVMQQEQEFLAALESATTWAIDRGMLDLHRADGERVVLAQGPQK